MARRWPDTATALPELRFANARLDPLGIEPMTLAELRAKASARHLEKPTRVDFFMLMLVTGGSGTHVVDFVEWPLQAGSLLFLRPGQVNQWRTANDLEAQLILIAPSTLPHRDGLVHRRELELLALDDWPTCQTLGRACASELAASLVPLQQAFAAFDGSALDIALVRHELMGLLLRIARQQRRLSTGNAATPAQHAIYRLFRQALEDAYTAQHGLAHYAHRLGYSASTLSRACLAAEGRPAKQVIDRRLALEAQRLLVHSTASVAAIGHQLGFTETTNFVKFFRRLLGATPAAFRRAALPGAAHEPHRSYA